MLTCRVLLGRGAAIPGDATLQPLRRFGARVIPRPGGKAPGTSGPRSLRQLQALAFQFCISDWGCQEYTQPVRT